MAHYYEKYGMSLFPARDSTARDEFVQKPLVKIFRVQILKALLPPHPTTLLTRRRTYSLRVLSWSAIFCI